MKPSLSTEIKYLKGVGPKRAEALNSVGIHTFADLLDYFPRKYIDRANMMKIEDIKVGDQVTIIGQVEDFNLKSNRKGFGGRFELMLTDDTGRLQLVWFQGAQWVKNAFEVGETIAVYGKVDQFGYFKQIAHPEVDRLDSEESDNFIHTGALIPLYPSTEFLRRMSLESRGFRKLIYPILDMTSEFQETLSPEIILAHQLLPLSAALRQIHQPITQQNRLKAEERIKFEELFYLQLMMAIRKKSIQSPKGIPFTERVTKTKTLLAKLPFELTAAQKKVIREIYNDMLLPRPMNRLVQGDVGSGKTIVAVIAILLAVENGYQTAFMAPTEILAEQHYFVLQELLWELGVRIALIKGGQKKSERESILEDIRTHQVDIVIGTHAIFQERVEFEKLGFVVIDEQHRFGVMQRAEIRQKAVAKGFHPDVLVMTATPIPRTLAMAIYGDLDISIIGEMPVGRKPIKTAVRNEGAREKIYAFLREQVTAGRQIYIVYPLIEESEKIDLKAAKEAFEELQTKIYPDLRIGLLHGKMKSAEKQDIMAKLKKHELDILVSTTVIEVGINIPNASVMLIEHAERFGLSQLHQLRGRVGRGSDQSYCILMVGKKFLMEHTEIRLNVMEETTDGFQIAEEDLKLRGPGEFLGTKQSGLPELKLANIIWDKDLMALARTSAFDLIEKDPQLRAPQNSMIKEKFERLFREKIFLGDVS